MINSKCSLTKRLVFITFKLSKQIIISKVRLDMNVKRVPGVSFMVLYPCTYIMQYLIISIAISFSRSVSSYYTHILCIVQSELQYFTTRQLQEKMIMNVKLVFSYCSVDHANQLQYPTSCESQEKMFRNIELVSFLYWVVVFPKQMYTIKKDSDVDHGVYEWPLKTTISRVFGMMFDRDK